MEASKNRPAEVIKGIDFWRKVEYRKGKFRKMKIPSSMFEPKEGRYYGFIALKHWKENSLWAIRIEESDSRLFMTKGLNRFCRHFNVNHGSILWFEYECKNKFIVKVGGRNGITYNPRLEFTATAAQLERGDCGNQLNETNTFVAYWQSGSILVPDQLVKTWCLDDVREYRLKLSTSLDFPVKSLHHRCTYATSKLCDALKNVVIAPKILSTATLVF